MKFWDNFKNDSRWRLRRRAIKFWWQRRTRGWSDDETWNLDCQLAEWIIPRLKRFKQLTIAYPTGLSSDKWNEMIDDMVYMFEKVKEDVWDYPDDERYVRGQQYFMEYWRGLWW